MRCTTGDEGAATAEFAVALPAIALVLATCLGAVQLVATQVRMQDAASQAARALGRGDDPSEAISTLPGARVTARASGGLECATVSAPARALGGVRIDLSATSCAQGDGR